jgi:hypothetical protein
VNKFGLRLRDVVFGLGGAAILYHEVAISNTAEPLLVFAAFFLLGLIPASRADEADQSSIKAWLRSWLLKDLDIPPDLPDEKDDSK